MAAALLPARRPARRARVLFVGSDYYGSNATSLRNAILRRGHDCLTVNTPHDTLWLQAMQRLVPDLRVAGDARDAWNQEIVRAADAWRPDVVVVFKGVDVQRATLSALSATTVHYHPDDSTNSYNRSSTYDLAESAYDLHVTTKTHNVDELSHRGVRSVLYVPCAYDRDWHVPATTAPWRVGADVCRRVGFIGTRRPARGALMRRLARRLGKDLVVCGARWRRDPMLVRHASVRGPQYGLDMSLSVAEAPIQLGLLNPDNRDRHTCRSYEVPAAGGVLVAVRTDEHMAMLEDGREAVFFSTEQEMLEQIERLRGDRSLVEAMSEAAMRRIRGGGNTYEDRWDQILSALDAGT